MDNKKPEEGLYPHVVNIELGIINPAFSDEPPDPGTETDDGTTPHPSAPRLDDVDNEISVVECENGKRLGNERTQTNSRDTWGHQIEFLLSCVAMSVGLGNVWRFPFTAYENGGGAFMIPYLIVLVLIGRPMYYLEMCLGQFSSLGPVKVWEVSPFFRGVGYASMIAACCTASFYCSIMAITIYYIYASVFDPLPWSQQVCQKASTTGQQSAICEASQVSNTSFAELYYTSTVFPQYPSIDNGLGWPHENLVYCLLTSWVVIFVFLARGIKTAAKLSYFTALFPYVVLTAILVRGVTLPGAAEGIMYLFKPDWSKLLDAKVWFTAVSQCFFSLNVGFGTIISLSSHNKFRNNVHRDALVIAFTDTFTSVLAGCAIFSMLGYLAHSMDVPISQVTKGGPGLAFVAFPESITHLTFFPQVFGFLFFLMLFTLGVGSAIALAGQCITIALDQFPDWKKWKVALVVCSLGFLSGIVYITPGGQFILTLVNHNGVDFIIYITGTLEIVAVSWVYGVNRFCDDIKFMINKDTAIYWKICWAFFMPVGLLALLVYFFVKGTQLTHEGVPFPTVALVCGWVLSGIILITLPICAYHSVKKSPGDDWFQKLKTSFKPLPSWGPKAAPDRESWFQMIAFRDILKQKVNSNSDGISNASTAQPASVASADDKPETT